MDEASDRTEQDHHGDPSRHIKLVSGFWGGGFFVEVFFRL